MIGTRLFSALLILAAAPASAQSGLDNLSSVATMQGTCARLVVRGADRSGECAGRVINSAHTDGRSGFAFFVGDAVISFAGEDSAAIGDRATLHVDELLVTRTHSGNPPAPEIVPARGTCEYTNPYAGVSTITCTATTAQGAFAATFRSDGREPEVQSFRH